VLAQLQEARAELEALLKQDGDITADQMRNITAKLNKAGQALEAWKEQPDSREELKAIAEWNATYGPKIEAFARRVEWLKKNWPSLQNEMKQIYLKELVDEATALGKAIQDLRKAHPILQVADAMHGIHQLAFYGDPDRNIPSLLDRVLNKGGRGATSQPIGSEVARAQGGVTVLTCAAAQANTAGRNTGPQRPKLWSDKCLETMRMGGPSGDSLCRRARSPRRPAQANNKLAHLKAADISTS
jgi:hypothetical protein